jgi:hypothetical protein
VRSGSTSLLGGSSGHADYWRAGTGGRRMRRSRDILSGSAQRLSRLKR